ncbi:oligosaccharide flippase family protein [Flavobacterium rakeshii]|uniref:Oligosaccharide flippase family protein n=1 Tax=Flavobacterium rakeshii TaxID=1038845 RepID=A0A6N8HCN4_9FLAO|nr:polysaccharide biosynthesis C-terminal domain-containing protein [Flavobacterium rakeshii]MUV03733.1 oligosaccharide flippase family protein [Flavobacterium rakeshii]
MGNKVIHKQAFFYTVINYLGTAIGIVSALFIYPLDYGFSGIIKFIDYLTQLLYPVMVLGASHALIKFYPALDNQKRKQLFNYSLVSISVASLVVLVLIFLFDKLTGYKDIILVYFSFPIAISLAFIDLFRKQAQQMQRLAVPTLFEKIMPKVALPLLFILLLNNVLGVNESLFFYVLTYVFIFLFTGFYLFRYFQPGYNYRFKTLFGEISRKDYFRYSLFSFAGSFGSVLAFRIDGIVVFNFISDEANGIFGNAVTIASAMQVPAVGLFALYAPIISDYLKSENFKDLHVKYKETARLLFFIGALLYSCIFLGIDDLFRLLPSYDKLSQMIPVICISGFSVLINMATGFNTEIITYSKYYRFNMIAILCLVGLNVPLNLFVVYYTDWGIEGIAWASFLSVTLFNALKMIFIYKKFGLLPFDKAFVKMGLIFGLSLAIIYILPDVGNNLINLVYKTGLSLLINIIAVYKLRLVYQVNVWMDKALLFTKKK